MCVCFADKKTEVWRRGLIQVQIAVQRLPEVRTGPLTHFFHPDQLPPYEKRKTGLYLHQDPAIVFVGGNAAFQD